MRKYRLKPAVFIRLQIGWVEKTMLNLCVTFDYELFMGENYRTEDEILIRPSDAIGEMLHEIGVRATFFADVCCPMRYRQLGRFAFPQQFDEQLVRLHALGHDVQLHIHPNWLAADEVGKTVRFAREKFRLHNWASGEDYAPVAKIISEGKAYLERLLTPGDPGYRCVAFRAGGYCLQPEQKLARPILDAGLVIDSSVCCGFAHEGDGMHYDYKAFPAPFNCFFSENVGLEARSAEATERSVFEIPVGGFGRFPQRLIASRMNGSFQRSEVGGRSMSLEPCAPSKGILRRIRNSVGAANMLTFDSYNAGAMTYMLRSLAKHTKNELFTAVIAHPKMMRAPQIADMRTTLLSLKGNGALRFVTMTDSAELLGLLPEKGANYDD